MPLADGPLINSATMPSSLRRTHLWLRLRKVRTMKPACRLATAKLLRYLFRDRQRNQERNRLSPSVNLIVGGQTEVRPAPGRFDLESDPQLELHPARDVALRSDLAEIRAIDGGVRPLVMHIVQGVDEIGPELQP